MSILKLNYQLLIDIAPLKDSPLQNLSKISPNLMDFIS